MMKVEQLYPGFQWAEPVRKGAVLHVERVGEDLLITGRFPSYQEQGRPSDLLHEYETARKDRSVFKNRGKNSPHVRFANADSDDDLIAFVRTFGPVVAKSVQFGNEPPFLLTATQDVKELRNEQVVYRAAFSLVMKLRQPRYDFVSGRSLIEEIVNHIYEWHQQWEREGSQRRTEPEWRLSPFVFERIKALSSAPPDRPLPSMLDGRIVICELLNVFRSKVFPNPLEMHSSIRYGIRPLLYSILGREFLYPHDTGVCGNTHCRQFFEVERAGQKFCDDNCSRHQRQRDYWKLRGKKLRAKRLKKRRN